MRVGLRSRADSVQAAVLAHHAASTVVSERTRPSRSFSMTSGKPFYGARAGCGVRNRDGTARDVGIGEHLPHAMLAITRREAHS
jgi:hypothetical protein